jgi:hypothetical protein
MSKLLILPSLSFIFQKPKPLGIELKTAAYAKVKIMLLGMEIQEGELSMRTKPYYLEVSATVEPTSD